MINYEINETKRKIKNSYLKIVMKINPIATVSVMDFSSDCARQGKIHYKINIHYSKHLIYFNLINVIIMYASGQQQLPEHSLTAVI